MGSLRQWFLGYLIELLAWCYQGLQKYPYCLSSKTSFTKTYIKMGIRGSLQILITTTKEEKTGN